MRDRQRGTTAWRIRATGHEPTELRWEWNRVKGIDAPLDIAERPQDRWLTPDRSFLSRFHMVRIHYPLRAFAVFGVDTPWWLAFLLGTMLFAWLFGKALGVRY